MSSNEEREEALAIMRGAIGEAEYARQLAEVRRGVVIVGAASDSASAGRPLAQFWAAEGDAQLMVLPGRPSHIFLLAETAKAASAATAAADSALASAAATVEPSAAAAAAAKGGEHILLYLDTSASMNHDERGLYQAPKSPDHPASSIRKARESFPAIVLHAVKRGAAVTIVPWHYKLHPAIEFAPERYRRDGDGDELATMMSDDEILADVRERTSEAVFRAGGGTSIEGALRDAAARCKALAPRCSGVSLWLVTDGEETVYVERSSGVARPVPTNPADGLFKFFTARDARTGITSYQTLLAEDVHDLRLAVEALGTSFRFHVAYTGDAEPRFLAALREASDGHFHVLANLSSMAEEISAVVTDASARGTVTVTVEGVADELVLPATLHDEAICVRSALPADSDVERGLNDARSVTIRIKPAGVSAGASVERVLCHRREEIPCTQLREGIEMALTLEPGLGAIIGRLAADQASITRDDVVRAAEGLRRLRFTRTEALGAISRHVRAGTLLAAFLESLLESVDSQINELSRTLEQFAATARREYDAAAAQRNDMLRERDRQAIGAGLESMKVRLGSGFVSRTGLDREVQRIVAIHAPRARRMLARSCVLVEGFPADVPDEKLPDGRTKLTLLVIDGDELARARNAAAVFVADGNSAAKFVSERLWHDLSSGEAMAEITAQIGDGHEVQGTMPLAKLYPRSIETVVRTPKATALRECCRRLLDPLSMCSFLDLIREHGTLPAALYTVAASQSAGVLFDAKELLQVISGGADVTSLAYFRLYWRLGHDAQGMCTVPGAFHAANCALPLAPEPLTGTILSCMLSCLFTEFVTGTPLAPLTAAGNLYIGFLLMHMRQPRHSALDIERIGQLLASLGTWLANTHIRPGPEEAAALVDMLVSKQAVPPGESPGRFFPARAYLYSVLDQRHPIEARFSGLASESMHRALRALLPASAHQSGSSGASAKLLDVQVPLRDFLRSLVDKLSGPASAEEDGIPIAAIETAKAIAAANTDEARAAFINALPGRKETIALALRDLLIDRTALGFPAFASWAQTQRMLYVWWALTTFPMDELLRTFADFEAPSAFESHVSRILKHAESETFFANALWSWAEAGCHCTLICSKEGKLGVRTVSAADAAVTETIQDERELPKLCKVFSGLLSMWTWMKGGASSVYGLHEVDYDVVRALRAPASSAIATMDRLTQTQQSLFHAAIEGRNAAYRQFASTSPSRPQEIQRIARADHYAPPQTHRDLTEKPRISVVSIGSFDHGKSTVLGHVLYKCGFVEPHVLERYERMSRQLGKEGTKFAWVLERLREERERGETIELSSWSMATPRFEVDLIDLPGHRAFVKNMAVGASLADVALLVVSAASGEFETGIAQSGMTREELLMAFTQGVRQYVLVVTKMDAVGYREDRFREVVSNVMNLAQRNGIHPETMPAVPVSGLHGGNLAEPDRENFPWFEGWTKTLRGGEVVRGTTLLEAIDATETPPRESSAPLRIPIVRSYRVAGIGTVAVGRVCSGTLLPSQKVILQPSGIEATAVTIEVYHNRREKAEAGDLIGFACRGASVDDVKRGLVACPISEGRDVRRLRSFVAQVIIVHHPGSITAGYTPYFHAHTGSWPARFSTLLAKIDKRTGARIEESPQSLRNGDAALVEITPLSAVFLEPFKAQSHLGRFAVRDGGVVVAVGIVQSVDYNAPAAAAPSVSRRGRRFFHGGKRR